MKKFLANEIVQRTMRTFIQGFCASLVVTLNSTTTYDEKLVTSALIGAVAGGFCAVMNYIIELLNKKKESE